MSDLALINANLWRKKLRTVLLLVAIFVAFLIFGVLASVQRSFYSGEETAAANRLITVNKVNFTLSMPIAYLQRVRALEGVEHVSPAVWYGGYFQEPRNFVQTFVVEPESYLQVYSELVIPDAQRAAFLNDRAGLLVGRAVAEQYGWEVGDQVPLLSNIWQNEDGGYAWTFTLRAIFDADDPSVPTNYALFHYEYFDEARSFGEDSIGWMALTTVSADRNDEVIEAIDTMFANSPFETETQTEAAFNAAFAEQFGNIGLILTLVTGAAFVTILLIVGNTMVMAVRERTKEIGVLKTLGFTNGRIFRQVLGESLLLALIGGLLGLGLAWLLVTGASEAVAGFLPGLALTPTIALTAFAIMIALGLVTGLIPAANAMRMRIIEALGRG